MMYCKAKLFKDEVSAEKILKTPSPKQQKALGRNVANYVDALWVEKREQYVKAGCLAKFSQNVQLYDFLLQTNDTILVEASKYDAIWGAGIDAMDPRINDPSKWPGLNLLGKVLMQVRKELKVRDEKLVA